MDEEKLSQIEDKIAEALLQLGSAIRDICEPLTDDEISNLAEHYAREALPTKDKTFPMPIYNEIVSMLQGELGVRCVFRAAEEHMKSSKENFFCVACWGDCKGHE